MFWTIIRASRAVQAAFDKGTEADNAAEAAEDDPTPRNLTVARRTAREAIELYDAAIAAMQYMFDNGLSITIFCPAGHAHGNQDLMEWLIGDRMHYEEIRMIVTEVLEATAPSKLRAIRYQPRRDRGRH